MRKKNTTNYSVTIYNEDSPEGSGKFFYGAPDTYVTRITLPYTGNYRLNSITDTGFIYNKSPYDWTDGYYFAVGDI